MSRALSQEINFFAGVIPPQTVNTGSGAVTSTVVDARDYEQVTARVNIGTVAAADVVILLEQGNTVAMGSAKLLKTYTVTAAAIPSDKQVVMTVQGQDFDTNNQFRWCRLTITHDEATGGPIAAELEGSEAKSTGDQFNPATVIVVPYP